MKNGTAWLRENWNKPDFWEQAETIQHQMPIFYEYLLSGNAEWEALTARIKGDFNSFVEILDTAMPMLGGLPNSEEITAFLSDAKDGINWIINSPIWGELSAAFSAGSTFAVNTLSLLVDAGVAVGLVMAAPAALPPVLAGAALRALPECYQVSIFDALVTFGMAGLSGAFAVIAGPLPMLAPSLQASVVGALEGFKSLDPAKKAEMIHQLGELLTVSFIADLLKGLFVGFGEISFTCKVIRFRSKLLSSQTLYGRSHPYF